MKNPHKRLNRVQVEWSKVLDPYEYTLLDKILFQSNLTRANHGTGFKFHIRQLERETHLNKTTISRLFKKWRSFLTKQPMSIPTREYNQYEFLFHYQECMNYMENLIKGVSARDAGVSVGDRAVSTGDATVSGRDAGVSLNGHRSKKEEVLEKEEEKVREEVAKIPELYKMDFKEDTVKQEVIKSLEKSSGDFKITESLKVGNSETTESESYWFNKIKQDMIDAATSQGSIGYIPSDQTVRMKLLVLNKV